MSEKEKDAGESQKPILPKHKRLTTKHKPVNRNFGNTYKFSQILHPEEGVEPIREYEENGIIVKVYPPRCATGVSVQRSLHINRTMEYGCD